MFPFSIRVKLKYKTEEIGISSIKYIQRIINTVLDNYGFVILRNKEGSIFFHKGHVFMFWSKRDFIDNGLITIKRNDTNATIEIRLISYFIIMPVWILFISGITYFIDYSFVYPIALFK